MLCLLLAAVLAQPTTQPATRPAPEPTTGPSEDFGNVDLARMPAVSPDGATITFTWRGDVWKAPTAGGEAVRLTAHPADDLGSGWTDDGRIVFESDRAGGRNLFVLPADGGVPTQLTFDDRALILSDVAGGRVLLSSYAEPDVYRARRMYSVELAGAGELERLTGAFGEHPQQSPDGKLILFTRGNDGWDRRGNTGPDTRDVWLYDTDAQSFHQLTDQRGNDGRATWVDDTTFVMLSERGGSTQLYAATLDDNRTAIADLRQLTTGETDIEDVSVGGGAIVFSRFGRLYRADLDGNVEPIKLSAAADTGSAVRVVDVARESTEAQLSPDGNALASVAYGQVFIRGTAEKAPTRRVTTDLGVYSDIAWSPDGSRLYFTGDHNGVDAIYAATVGLTVEDVKNSLADEPTTQPATQPTTEPATQPTTEPATQPDAEQEPEQEPEPAPDFSTALRFDIEPIVTDAAGASVAVPSPDGTRLLWQRGVGDLLVRDLRSGTDTVLLDAWSGGLSYRWMPDGESVLYITDDKNFNADIWHVAAAGGDAVNLTRHPDDEYGLSVSADGKILTFLSARVADQFDVWQVWLDEDMTALSPAELDAYFEEAGKAAAKAKPPAVPDLQPAMQPASQPATQPTTQPTSDLELADAYLRLQRVTRSTDDETQVALTPDGASILYKVGDELMLLQRGEDAKRIAGNVTIQHVTADAKAVMVIDGGRPTRIDLPGGKATALPLDHTLRLDPSAFNALKFAEATRALGGLFYDADRIDAGWFERADRYGKLAAAAVTNDEFDFVANRFIGHLNASHLGVYSPSGSDDAHVRYGRLGITTQRDGDAAVVTDILDGGPADVGSFKLQIGDRITAVNGVPLTEDTTLRKLLANTVGRQTLIDITRDDKQGQVLLVPTSFDELRVLAYSAWERANRAYVEEKSGGKLGYIHIRGMDQNSLDEFERDLYAAADGKAGLLIDVRNNGGGWTTDRLLASIMYPRHAYTIPRGMGEGEDAAPTDGYPHDRLFIQRYDLPINMLANEKSFSNAEIISHAFKTLGRGTLVGNQTAGGVISTGGIRLLDNTLVRLPFRGWYLPDGTDMELNGAEPDILIVQSPQDEVNENDRQLDAAMADLLERLEAGEQD